MINRYVSALALGLLLCGVRVTQAAVYDDVFWVGGDGEWTGDVTATPEYGTGNWSTDPNATTGLPAKFVLGRNDGIRVNQVVGPGNPDADRVPCHNTGTPCDVSTEPIPGGIQLGTDIFINKPVTVSYNPNRQTLSSVGFQDRFGDFRFQPDPAFPGTPTLNLSNGAIFDHTTSIGGDEDGMWTRWNGAALNIDNATFRRRGDEANGFSGGAFMLASYHGYTNSVQTVNLTNGGRIENEGQLWFGISGNNVGGENEPGIDIIMTINDGHLDLTGGDEYALDNDNLEMRADLAFIYDWKHDADPENDETFVINFTGPGSITVDGEHPAPLDIPAAGAARGGIRVATNTSESGLNDYGNDANIQRSYQDLWTMGILQAHGQSGLTGTDFNDFFMVENAPGQNDYKLISLVDPITPGDFNGDGVVDAADYVVWRKNPDANGGEAGYNTWYANFGNGSGGGALGAAGVPEPSAILLGFVGLAVVWGAKRRIR